MRMRIRACGEAGCLGSNCSVGISESPSTLHFSAKASVPGNTLAGATRRTALASQLLARKSIDKLIRDSVEPGHSLNKTLGPWSITALGIGAVIGSGIFTVIGTAMAGQHFDVPSIRDTPLLH